MEIGLNCGALYHFQEEHFSTIADRLSKAGLRTLVHAPFTDISLGAIDPEIRSACLKRLNEALNVSKMMGASKLILHTGFDKRHYWGVEEKWLTNAKESLIKLGKQADLYNIEIVLENVFEPDWRVHEALLHGAKDTKVGFCYDIGHQMVFSKALQHEWLEHMSQWISHCHLHDNRGRHDEHLAIGKGMLDFDGLFRWLHEKGKDVTMTIEAHRKEDIFISLENLYKLLDRYPFR